MQGPHPCNRQLSYLHVLHQDKNAGLPPVAVGCAGGGSVVGWGRGSASATEAVVGVHPLAPLRRECGRRMDLIGWNEGEGGARRFRGGGACPAHAKRLACVCLPCDHARPSLAFSGLPKVALVFYTRSSSCLCTRAQHPWAVSWLRGRRRATAGWEEGGRTSACTPHRLSPWLFVAPSVLGWKEGGHRLIGWGQVRVRLQRPPIGQSVLPQPKTCARVGRVEAGTAHKPYRLRLQRIAASRKGAAS